MVRIEGKGVVNPVSRANVTRRMGIPNTPFVPCKGAGPRGHLCPRRVFATDGSEALTTSADIKQTEPAALGLSSQDLGFWSLLLSRLRSAHHCSRPACLSHRIAKNMADGENLAVCIANCPERFIIPKHL